MKWLSVSWKFVVRVVIAALQLLYNHLNNKHYGKD